MHDLRWVGGSLVMTLGIVFALNETIDEGHVYVPGEMLSQRAVELLEVPAELIPPGLERLAQADRIRLDMVQLNGVVPPDGKPAERPKGGEATGTYAAPLLYLTPLYYGEKGVAGQIKSLAQAPARSVTRPPFPDQDLSYEQRTAIDMALAHPVSVLTGGPGTVRVLTQYGRL